MYLFIYFLEFVYRSSIICVLYSHVSLVSIIFTSPLFFGLAHFHHMLEHFHQNSQSSRQRLSALTIVLIHLFQFSYTYVFGVYSSFLFLRTGHFIPSFIAHALCNSLGVPDFGSLFSRNDSHNWRKLVIIASYFLGLLLFSMNLYFLTQSTYYYAKDSMITYRL